MPNSFVLKLALGEAPEHVPSAFDVRRQRLSAALKLDGGPLDRVIRALAGSCRYTRVHAAAASLARPGHAHERFGEREHVIGLARTFRVDVPPGAPIAAIVKALAQLAQVESVSPNYVVSVPFTAALARASVPSTRARALVQQSEALAYEPGDPTVISAVVDSGVTLDHPELAPRLRPGFDTVQLGSDDFAFGIELLGDNQRPDGNPTDRFVGHGDACAAIIGALGLGMPPGIGGEGSVLPIRALGAARLTGMPTPVALGAITDLDAGMKLAVDLGARVINASFGTEDTSLDASDPKPHADAVRYALARGCAVVAASGNSGDDTLYWPAGFEGVIAVGACDERARPCSFSTRGAHVTLLAPGSGVLTAGVLGYQVATGTSFAAPFVAGAAALLIARGARRSYPLDGATIRRLLRESAQPLGQPADGCGAGVLDVYGALQALDREIDRARPGYALSEDD